MSVIVIPHEAAKQTLVDALSPHLEGASANQLADIFIDAELDGVCSHGLARFPRFINEVAQGFIYPSHEPSLVKSFAGWEMWNGNAGAGPLNALYCTRRAVEVASQFGLACIGLRNTNHWLRPGYYAKEAAKNGCAFIGWSNTMPNMRAHGTSETTLGNMPLTIALPAETKDQAPVFLDMALSQFSYGKIKRYVDDAEPLPVAGGYDECNVLTRDGKVITKNQSASAIGYWKGSALAMVLDLLGVFLGGGKSVYEIGMKPGEQDVSQVFMAVALDKLWGAEEYSTRLNELKTQLKAVDSRVHVPAESIVQKREKHLREGIVLSPALWEKICALKPAT